MEGRKARDIQYSGADSKIMEDVENEKWCLNGRDVSPLLLRSTKTKKILIMSDMWHRVTNSFC